ncbi:UL16-binding protein 1-like [Peromyscus californicus insignis]|uniref:UL16-binding protein 1-like n=1 Tax=Peromyscus californicus insignis TaxID=564181 RepID=UPI0022A78137|nr:UL16-binding protein 1-like [Peromyscus californicus insignis]
MIQIAVIKFISHYVLALILLLVVLKGCQCTPPPSDAASLSYSFTVGNSGSGAWWHEIEGKLNRRDFIYCDITHNCHAIGLLGNRLSATKIWQPQVDILKDGVDLLKAEMVDIKLETNTMRKPLTLQATMRCGYEVNGDFRGSWDFGLSGQKMLHFDSSTGKLTEVDSESSQMKSLLEKDEEVTDFLYRTSRGDCRSWLEEFKSHWEEKLEPTASPIAAPDVNKPPSLASKSNISVLLLILTCSLLLLL